MLTYVLVLNGMLMSVGVGDSVVKLAKHGNEDRHEIKIYLAE